MLASTPSASAVATDDETPAVRDLERLCDQKGGTVARTPFAVVRCQEARSNKGLNAPHPRPGRTP